MLQTYPLNPVVSSNSVLIANYNSSMMSASVMSACITPAEASDLLARGAKFSSMVLVNGEGQGLIEKIGDPNDWNEDTMPNIQSAWLDPNDQNAVEEIFNLIGNPQLDTLSKNERNFGMG